MNRLCKMRRDEDVASSVNTICDFLSMSAHVLCFQLAKLCHLVHLKCICFYIFWPVSMLSLHISINLLCQWRTLRTSCPAIVRTLKLAWIWSGNCEYLFQDQQSNRKQGTRFSKLPKSNLDKKFAYTFSFWKRSRVWILKLPQSTISVVD